MNDHVDFERTVAGHIANEVIPRPSDAFYDELFTRAGHSRQRPEWLALIKEPPMRTNSRLAVGSPMARVAAIVVATILATMLVVSAGIAGAQIFGADGPIVVDQSGNGTVETITEAVAMAMDGDEILVKPGTYIESITVDKDITITGDGGPEEIVVEIPEDGPTDATIFGSSTRYAFFLDKTNATVGNLTVVDPTKSDGTAFVVIGGSPTIHDVVANLEPSGARSGGFVLMDGGAGVIRHNTTDSFLWVDGGSTPEIVDNVSTWVIRANGIGTDPWIHGNVATGIWAHGGSAPLVEDNGISGSTNSGCGIEAGDAETRPTVRDNRVSENDVGICAYLGGSFAELIGNTVTGNGIGLRVSTTPEVPDLTGNIICDNDQNVVGFGEDAPSDEELCAEELPQ